MLQLAPPFPFPFCYPQERVISIEQLINEKAIRTIEETYIASSIVSYELVTIKTILVVYV